MVRLGNSCEDNVTRGDGQKETFVDINTLSAESREKVESIRKQIGEGSYPLDKNFGAVLDKAIDED